MWFDPALVVEYRPRASYRALARQFWSTGRWRREVVRRHRGTASMRYLAPPLTVLALLLGLVLGVLAGGTLALATAASPWLDRALLPLLTLTQTVPTVVLAPLMVLWGGVGLAPKVVLVALTVFFPVLVAAAGAMRDAEGELGDVLRGLGGTRREVLLLVRAPAALPGALSGLRLAATYAVGAAVVSEYLAGTSGLGVLIQRARKGYDVDRIFVAVALVALLTALLFVIVDVASRAALPWQRRESGNHLLLRRPA